MAGRSPAAKRVIAMEDGELNSTVAAVVGRHADFAGSWQHAMDAAEETGLLHPPYRLLQLESGDWKVQDAFKQTIARDKSGPRAISQAIAIKSVGRGEYYSEAT